MNELFAEILRLSEIRKARHPEILAETASDHPEIAVSDLLCWTMEQMSFFRGDDARSLRKIRLAAIHFLRAEGRTLKEVATVAGLSAERIRQLEAKKARPMKGRRS